MVGSPHDSHRPERLHHLRARGALLRPGAARPGRGDRRLVVLARRRPPRRRARAPAARQPDGADAREELARPAMARAPHAVRGLECGRLGLRRGTLGRPLRRRVRNHRARSAARRRLRPQRRRRRRSLLLRRAPERGREGAAPRLPALRNRAGAAPRRCAPAVPARVPRLPGARVLGEHPRVGRARCGTRRAPRPRARRVLVAAPHLAATGRDARARALAVRARLAVCPRASRLLPPPVRQPDPRELGERVGPELDPGPAGLLRPSPRRALARLSLEPRSHAVRADRALGDRAGRLARAPEPGVVRTRRGGRGSRGIRRRLAADGERPAPNSQRRTRVGAARGGDGDDRPGRLAWLGLVRGSLPCARRGRSRSRSRRPRLRDRALCRLAALRRAAAPRPHRL